MAASEAMVVVGAGQAGGRAALTLREAGHLGPIVLLGTETAAPYERPPLSKEFLQGQRTAETLTLANREALAEASIEFRPATTVTAIDRRERTVTLDDSSALPYAKLLLATGREPRRVPVAPELAGAVHVLRDLADAEALRAKLVPGARLAIVGGGFIGLEVAASARALGAEATVIEILPRLLSRCVPPRIAASLERRHAAAGVEVILGRSIEQIAPAARGASIQLDDGRVIKADAVLVGIGATPRIVLAKAAGLAVDRGILVDDLLRTSDPDIYAAGDVTACPHPSGDGLQRLESWQNAEEQGARAARNMLGAGERCTGLPWFWSDQYELSLQMAGHPELGARTIERAVGDDGLLLFHLANSGQVVGLSGVGPTSFLKEFKVARVIAERGLTLDPTMLGDPATRLKTLLH
jgi:3-phenylpropionate/trans-cinnamate dioxygenase ferredoxin reductase component